MVVTAREEEQASPAIKPVEEVLFEKLGWEPHKEQAIILRSKARQVLVAGGERSGKSDLAAKFLIQRVPLVEEKGLYWLVAADYERTRAEFDYLVEGFGKLGLLLKASKRVDPGWIEIGDGTRIETKSASDPRTLAMKAPHGIVICEASQVDLETYWKCRARIAEKRGWLLMVGTFETSLGWFPSLFTEWRIGRGDKASFPLPTPSNIHIYPGGINDPEIQRLKAECSDDFFMERIMGEPRPPRGLVFPEFKTEYHIGEVEWVPGEKVLLWIDPGYSGAYAVEAVQIIGGQVRVFDEVFERALVTEDIIQMVTSTVTRPWWKDVVGGAIDIAGYQHHAMPAAAEIWLERAGLSLLAERVGINEGIERLKSMLKVDPLTQKTKFVSSPRCRGLHSEFGAAPNPFDGQLRAYKWRTDREGNMVGDTPDDKNNNAIKAIIYGLVSELGYVTVTRREFIKVKRF